MSSSDQPITRLLASPWMKRLDRLARWLTWLIIAGFTWTTFIEPEMVVRHDHIHSPSVGQWPVGCQGLRVVVASDFHVGDPHMMAWRRQRIFSTIQEAKPDLILVPGDLVGEVLGGKTPTMAQAAATLKPLQSIAPTYVVLGNHDINVAPPHLLIADLKAAGFIALSNESVEASFKQGACKLWVAGVSDKFSNVAAPTETLKSIPQGAPIIALTHDARVQPELPPGRVDWMAAGHTHGGVVCVPGTLWCMSRIHAWTGGYVRGWYAAAGKTPTLVSSGLGNSIYPGRFGSPPAIDVVELRLPSAK